MSLNPTMIKILEPFITLLNYFSDQIFPTNHSLVILMFNQGMAPIITLIISIELKTLCSHQNSFYSVINVNNNLTISSNTSN